MKKSTGIVFLVVVALGAVAYFYEWKRHPFQEDPDVGIHTPFSIKEGDVTQITLTRAGATTVFDRKDDGWYISKPIATRADQSAVNNIAHYLAIVPVDRTVTAPPDQQAAWGLASPAQILEFKVQSGATHKLRMGAGDFSNLEVYAQVDDSQDVVLIANVLFKSADKSLDDFRDHSLLPFTPEEVAAFDLHNESGNISAERSGSSWKVLKPLTAPGASDAIASLLNAARSGRITRFVSDAPNAATPSVLEQYGLARPAVRFQVTLVDGKSVGVLLGKKDGSEQYAMDVSQSSIVRVPATFSARLNLSFLDLRAKTLFAGQNFDLARIEVRNQNGTTSCVKDPKSGTMVIEQGSGSKEPAPACPDFLDPLQHARARRINDQPSADVNAKLSKPAIQVSLTRQTSATDQNTTKTEIEISPVSGNSVYGRTSLGPTVYEFDSEAFDALNVKPSAPAK